MLDWYLISFVDGKNVERDYMVDHFKTFSEQLAKSVGILYVVYMNKLSQSEIIQSLVKADPRYKAGAYEFVRDALDFTLHLVTPDTKRHISGKELLEGVREFALKQYGPMAMRVLAHWGIRRSEDVGQVVFNMVRVELLGKSDQDSMNDFENGYDFAQAFVHPFLPEVEPAISSSDIEPSPQRKSRRAPKASP